MHLDKSPPAPSALYCMNKHVLEPNQKHMHRFKLQYRPPETSGWPISTSKLAKGSALAAGNYRAYGSPP